MSKLTYEDKINLHNVWKLGLSRNSLSNKYNISAHGIQYLCCLIDKHGMDILRTKKNKYYPKYIKQNAIGKVLVNKEAIWAFPHIHHSFNTITLSIASNFLLISNPPAYPTKSPFLPITL